MVRETDKNEQESPKTKRYHDANIVVINSTSDDKVDIMATLGFQLL